MKRLFAVLLFAAVSTAAQPVITSVSPSTGPIEGGTQVTIKGSGFHMCLFCNPPVPLPVYFGGTYAPATATDVNTIIVNAPPHFAGTVDITVVQEDGTATRPNAFTYSGVFEEKFERILLPLFTEPVAGAFGSRFITQLRAANTGDREAYLFGLTTADPRVEPFEHPYVLQPTASRPPETFEYRGKPGAFIYLPVTSPRPELNLRVFDESRDAFNFGTEMPVVFEREFTTAPTKLLNVYLDPIYRNTLRIYATAATLVTVSFGKESRNVFVAAGANLFEPAYAQVSEFPSGTGDLDVTVRPSGDVPVWAFITVTNNESQLITTISPQR